MPKNPKMTEKDFQPGESKDEVEQIMSDRAPASTLKLFNQDKWNEKVVGYEELATYLHSEGIPLDLIEHSVRFIKLKQKDWKESNMNLVKAALNFMIKVFGSAFKVGQRATNVVLPFISDKLGDPKFVALCSEVILILSEKVTPSFVIKGLAKQGQTQTNPKSIEQSAIMIEKILTEFGPQGFPLQEAVGYSVFGCSHTNPKVRDVSIKLIASIYKYAGDPIRDFLKDVKESTRNVINDVLSKTEQIKVVAPPKRQVIGEDGKPIVAEIGGSMLDNLPRADVSKDLSNSKLIEKMRNTNWKTKKEGYDQVEKVMSDANN